MPGSAPHSASSNDSDFDEYYEGRRITGSTQSTHPRAAGPDGHGHGGATAAIDGHSMHVMRLADGTFTTQINHYEHFSTLRDAVRAAVDTLGPNGYPVSLTAAAAA